MNREGRGRDKKKGAIQPTPKKRKELEYYCNNNNKKTKTNKDERNYSNRNISVFFFKFSLHYQQPLTMCGVCMSQSATSIQKSKYSNSELQIIEKGGTQNQRNKPKKCISSFQ